MQTMLSFINGTVCLIDSLSGLLIHFTTFVSLVLMMGYKEMKGLILEIKLFNCKYVSFLLIFRQFELLHKHLPHILLFWCVLLAQKWVWISNTLTLSHGIEKRKDPSLMEYASVEYLQQRLTFDKYKEWWFIKDKDISNKMQIHRR